MYFNNPSPPKYIGAPRALIVSVHPTKGSFNDAATIEGLTIQAGSVPYLSIILISASFLQNV